eukprot:TRINITY_DN6678_c0_g2_i1.p1 TRINITY_DN6678_c0_g2~~TRINITY_DN6678_c0_g2_i1.p1  ORF type:complete len:332 (-),score=62.94 TRINITY_DN6678_c0_g2_i1:80-1075(-)
MLRHLIKRKLHLKRTTLATTTSISHLTRTQQYLRAPNWQRSLQPTFLLNSVGGVVVPYRCYSIDTPTKKAKYDHLYIRGLGNYEGDTVNGKPHGNGSVRLEMEGAERLMVGRFFDGQIVKGKVENLETGAFYKGEFRNFQYHGYGRIKREFTYEGTWEYGKPHGRGIMKYEDNSEYSGQFKNGKRYGEGKFVSPGVLQFEGSWKDDVYYRGKLINEQDGSSFEGLFENGEIFKGVGKLANGIVYTGAWKDGLPDGFGKMVFPDNPNHPLFAFFDKGEPINTDVKNKENVFDERAKKATPYWAEWDNTDYDIPSRYHRGVKKPDIFGFENDD